MSCSVVRTYETLHVPPCGPSSSGSAALTWPRPRRTRCIQHQRDNHLAVLEAQPSYRLPSVSRSALMPVCRSAANSSGRAATVLDERVISMNRTSGLHPTAQADLAESAQRVGRLSELESLENVAQQSSSKAAKVDSQHAGTHGWQQQSSLDAGGTGLPAESLGRGVRPQGTTAAALRALLSLDLAEAPLDGSWEAGADVATATVTPARQMDPAALTLALIRCTAWRQVQRLVSEQAAGLNARHLATALQRLARVASNLSRAERLDLVTFVATLCRACMVVGPHTFNAADLTAVLWALARLDYSPGRRWLVAFLGPAQATTAATTSTSAQPLLSSSSLSIPRPQSGSDPDQQHLDPHKHNDSVASSEASSTSGTRSSGSSSSGTSSSNRTSAGMWSTRLVQFEPRHISNVCWALGRLHLHPGEAWLAGLCEHAAMQVQELSPQGVSQVMWGVARLGYVPAQQHLAQLVAAIDAGCSSRNMASSSNGSRSANVSHHHQGYSARDIAQCLWSLARMSMVLQSSAGSSRLEGSEGSNAGGQGRSSLRLPEGFVGRCLDRLMGLLEAPGMTSAAMNTAQQQGSSGSCSRPARRSCDGQSVALTLWALPHLQQGRGALKVESSRAGSLAGLLQVSLPSMSLHHQALSLWAVHELGLPLGPPQPGQQQQPGQQPRHQQQQQQGLPQQQGPQPQPRQVPPLLAAALQASWQRLREGTSGLSSSSGSSGDWDVSVTDSISGSMGGAAGEGQALAMMLTALARMRCRPPRAWMLSYLDACQRTLPVMAPQAQSGVLWALATLEYRPPKHWLRLVYYRASAHKLHAYSPQALALAAWAVARLRHKPSRAWMQAFLHASGGAMAAMGTPGGAVAAATAAEAAASGSGGSVGDGSGGGQGHKQARGFTARELCLTLWALGRLRVKPPACWSALALDRLHATLHPAGAAATAALEATAVDAAAGMQVAQQGQQPKRRQSKHKAAAGAGNSSAVNAVKTVNAQDVSCALYGLARMRVAAPHALLADALTVLRATTACTSTNTTTGVPGEELGASASVRALSSGRLAAQHVAMSVWACGSLHGTVPSELLAPLVPVVPWDGTTVQQGTADASTTASATAAAPVAPLEPATTTSSSSSAAAASTAAAPTAAGKEENRSNVLQCSNTSTSSSSSSSGIVGGAPLLLSYGPQELAQLLWGLSALGWQPSGTPRQQQAWLEAVAAYSFSHWVHDVLHLPLSNASSTTNSTSSTAGSSRDTVTGPDADAAPGSNARSTSNASNRSNASNSSSSSVGTAGEVTLLTFVTVLRALVGWRFRPWPGSKDSRGDAWLAAADATRAALVARSLAALSAGMPPGTSSPALGPASSLPGSPNGTSNTAASALGGSSSGSGTGSMQAAQATPGTQVLQSQRQLQGRRVVERLNEEAQYALREMGLTPTLAAHAAVLLAQVQQQQQNCSGATNTAIAASSTAGGRSNGGNDSVRGSSGGGASPSAVVSDAQAFPLVFAMGSMAATLSGFAFHAF